MQIQANQIGLEIPDFWVTQKGKEIQEFNKDLTSRVNRLDDSSYRVWAVAMASALLFLSTPYNVLFGALLGAGGTITRKDLVKQSAGRVEQIAEGVFHLEQIKVLIDKNLQEINECELPSTVSELKKFIKKFQRQVESLDSYTRSVEGKIEKIDLGFGREKLSLYFTLRTWRISQIQVDLPKLWQCALPDKTIVTVGEDPKEYYHEKIKEIKETFEEASSNLFSSIQQLQNYERSENGSLRALLT